MSARHFQISNHPQRTETTNDVHRPLINVGEVEKLIKKTSATQRLKIWIKLF